MVRIEVWRRRSPERRALIALGASMSAAAGPAVLAAPASALSPGCTRSGREVTCYYGSGTNKVWIPPGVTSVDVTAVGGTGATSGPGGDEGGIGGTGDEVTGSLPVTGPTVLWALVGGNASGSTGGANGGGDGGSGELGAGGGGGGASDVRTSESDLTSRLLVAAGGGGGGASAETIDVPANTYTDVPGANGGNAGAAGANGGYDVGGIGGGAGTSTKGGSASLGSPPFTHELYTYCDVNPTAGALGVGGAGGGANPPCVTGGGGGGGGLYGGGGADGGGTVDVAPYEFLGPGGGGGGGSDLVPPGGSATVDTNGVPYVQISYNWRH